MSLVSNEIFQHILRVLNPNVDGKQKIMFALTSFTCFRRRFANIVCNKADVDMNKRAGELTAAELENLMTIVASPRQLKIPDWVLNRKKGCMDGRYSQVVSNALNMKLKDDLECLKKTSTASNMDSLRGGFLKGLRGISLQPRSSLGLNRVSQSWYSSTTFDEFEEKDEIADDDFINDRKELEPQGVDPKKGWGFRGVHKAIVCGKVGQAPVQKILRNGRTVTIFSVGTGGMYDQRIVGGAHLPRPAQWHRIAVHNEFLGAYSVQQLMKDSAVFVEGDIETRVYNDAISGQVKNVPEICVRRDGKVRLIKSGDSASNISLDGLRNGLF